MNRVTVKFIAICALLLFLADQMTLEVSHWVTYPTAWLAGLLLHVLGGPVQVAGELLVLDGSPVKIIHECSALNLVAVFGAYVVASPAPWSYRISGLAAGTSFLIALNTVRIAIASYVVAYYPLWFDLVHVYLGQVAMIIAVIGCCAVWQRRPDVSRVVFRVLLWSGILFVAWAVIQSDVVNTAGNALVYWITDGKALIPPKVQIYYQTFSVVVIAGILAACWPNVRNRPWIAVSGLAAITVIQTLSLFGNLLGVADKVCGIAYVIGQCIVPVLLWMVITHKKGVLA